MTDTHSLDGTLVAGQEKSNKVAVGAADLTSSVGWVPIANLSGVDASSRLSNIYVCEFNRQRIKTDPKNEIVSYSANVVYNNVIPVDPTLATNDARYLDINFCLCFSFVYCIFDILYIHQLQMQHEQACIRCQHPVWLRQLLIHSYRERLVVLRSQSSW